MATNLDIGASLLAANTSYMIGYEGFYAARMPGAYAAYTEIMKADGNQITLNWLANHPVLAKWIGPVVDNFLRAYSQTTTMVPFIANLPIKRTLMAYDKTGAVAKAISDFFSGNIGAYDKAVFDEWMSASGAGPTCFDGTALFNTSHPHAVSGGVQSNIGAGSALSHSTLTIAEYSMRLFAYESGEPMDINPNALEVGPKLKVRAAELLSVDRLQTATAASVFDAGASAVAAGTRTSVWNGTLDLIVNPRMNASGTGHFMWTLMDLTKPGVRPMILQENRFPEPIVSDSMTAQRRLVADEFEYRLEGDYGASPGMWAVAYRGTGTA
jgi:phage major head subunit gpT-like protein